MVAADAAAGDDDRLAADLEVADLVAVGGAAALGGVGRQRAPVHADDGAVLDHQAVHAVPERAA